MAAEDIFEKYIRNNKDCFDLKFSKLNKTEEKLPNILIFTQLIIDRFIANNEKRIAIVLPSDDWNLIPLILSKAYSNIVNETSKSKPLIYEIEKGQRLRLGKAVVEFQSVDLQNNKITLLVGKTDQMTVTLPITNFVYMFEKCTGALSKWETWVEALKKAKIEVDADDIYSLTNRTAITKTIILLTSKNDFKKTSNEISINYKDIQSLITYGEIDCNSNNYFKLFNKGRLDCIPSIGVTSKISDISELLDKVNDYSSISSIYVTNDKISEIINNNNDFINCLRTDIPFIIFLSESDYEVIGKLTDFGFKLWHWKPSTINNKVFIQNNYKSAGVFGNLPSKIKNAAVANFSTKLIQVDQFKQNLKLIKQLSQLTEDKDAKLRQLTRQIWMYQNNLKSISFINEEIQFYFNTELTQIKQTWGNISSLYKTQELFDIIEYLLISFDVKLKDCFNYKEKLLKELLSNSELNNKRVLVLLPDKDFYENNTYFQLEKINNFKRINVWCLNQFYRNQENEFLTYDYVYVTWFDWFDRNDYLRIKQSYCYKQLIYVLFDFENTWRNALIKQIDTYIPHNEVIQNGKLIGLSKKDYLDIAFDFDEDEELDERY